MIFIIFADNKNIATVDTNIRRILIHELKLDENIYPLNNDKFIVFYYKINGVQVSKKVGFNKQHLIIEKDKQT